jgi:hypothetical protein
MLMAAFIRKMGGYRGERDVEAALIRKIGLMGNGG